MLRALVFLSLVSCGGAPRERPREALRVQVEVVRGGWRPRRGAPEPPDVWATRPVPSPIGPDVVRVRVPIDDAPARGPVDALVTIVEFADFQCPFCARVQATLRQVLANHPDDVRIVFRHSPLPFHPNASEAAQAAVEAGTTNDATFFTYADLLFDNARTLGRADLARLAEQVGVDGARIRQALADGRHLPRVEAERALAERIGARGTPAFFIDGRPLSGAQPLEAFENLVVEEIALARRMVEAGVPRTAIYDRLTAAGLPAIPEGPRAQVPPAPPAPPEPDVPRAVPILDSPVQGPSDALVTIVEFADFQCPFSSRVRATLRDVRARFGADVRVVFKHLPLPFHDRAMPAAEASVEALAQGGSAGFWAMHERLFDGQRALGLAAFERHARAIHLQPLPMRRAIERGTHRARVEVDTRLAAALGISGTPSFFVNGRKLVGAQPIETFARVIEAARADALARVARGTPRADVYESIQRELSGAGG